MPAVTKNSFGKGKAYYVATRPDAKFYHEFIKGVCEEKGIQPEANVPQGMEAVKRNTKDSSFLFLLNHAEEEKEVVLEQDCVEILTETVYNRGDVILLGKKEVAIFQI